MAYLRSLRDCNLAFDHFSLTSTDQLVFGDDFVQVCPSQCLFDAMYARVRVHCLPQTLEEWYPSGRSPDTGEKAVAHQNRIGRPFGMLREHSLLSVDAVDQRHPTNQYQEERDEIPFL
jgi:hypothetical protein